MRRQCEMAQVDVRDAEPVRSDGRGGPSPTLGESIRSINNHGASITHTDAAAIAHGWRAVIGINLDGVFFCSKSAARQFMEQKSGGAIINISSTAGVHGSATMLPYGASKAGVINLTTSHASEWVRRGFG